MKLLCFSLLITLLIGTQALAQYNQPNGRYLLDANWRFALGVPTSLVDTSQVNPWRWTQDNADLADAGTMAAVNLDTSGPSWHDANSGDDVFHGRIGFVWMRATLPQVHGPGREIHFDGVDDNADVFLNGKKLVHHSGWDEDFSVPVDSAWNPAGSNVLAILVENTDGPGGIEGVTTVGRAPSSNSFRPDAPGFDDHSWRVVHLPHDYVVEGKFTQSGDNSHASLPTPNAWYRKTFMLPVSAKYDDVSIDFDGVYRDATVWLNGVELGEHQSGYTSFRYDITKYAKFGHTNTLAVFVNLRHKEGWWYEGGGIYRHVWLNIASPVHIAHWGTFVTTSLKEPEPGQYHIGPANVTIQTTLVNGSPTSQTVVLTSFIVAPHGASASHRQAEDITFKTWGERLDQLNSNGGNTILLDIKTSRTPYHGPNRFPELLGINLPAYSSKTVTQTIAVKSPQLWSLESPNLYQVQQTVLASAGRTAILDREDTFFGIRTIRFDPNTGFYLNGKHVEIQGVCNHQDFAGVGIAVPDQLEYWRVRRLKEMGCNAWRMSHNPPTPALLDACDKLGMLVMDENRHLGDTYENHTPSGTPYSDLSDLASMIQRDRNHPSVIMWSMCNEEGLQGSDEGERIFKAMMDLVHKYDKTRPISCAMNGGWGSGISNVEDLQGINYNDWVYDQFHKAHPNMPMFGSETASDLTTRGEYADDKAKGYANSYKTTDFAWEPVAQRPFMAGSFAWTGFDYKGEPAPYGWPAINSNFGIMDMCGFPKDNYYYYKAWWNSKPYIHVSPHWNWPGKEGQNIHVMIFSNCKWVELELNGKNLGIKQMPAYEHRNWDVPYTPGTLIARGFSYGPKSVALGPNGEAEQAVPAVYDAMDTVRTTGAPFALRLSADRLKLDGDGEDIEPVEVDIVDRNGLVVPTAGNRVSFRVSGAGYVAGVGNGDPSDHDPDKASSRNAFHGKCLVDVGAMDTTTMNSNPGDIVLIAASSGLKPAVLHLTSSPPSTDQYLSFDSFLAHGGGRTAAGPRAAGFSLPTLFTEAQ